MKFVEYFRNLDSKKQTLIAGALVITLAGGSMALKVHHEKVNPSTSPVSADEVDSKDKLISQLRVENRKLKQQLNAQKTKNKSKSNSSNELVPYNLSGSLGRLGGGYNSIPLDYSTPTLEPAVYEPIIDEPTVEPVEDEIIEETDTPNVSEPIVNEVVAPPVTEPTVPNEEKVEEGINETSKFDVNTATYKGRNIVKHLPNMTYDVINTDNSVIIKVTGTNIQIEFTRVNNNEFNCTKLVKDGQELTGMERDKVLNELFNIQDGSNVPTPPEPPVIVVPDLNQPVEEPTPEQPPVKDDKVEEDNVVNPDNTGVTAPPPVTPPAPTAPPEAELVVG